jgi:hypothetical protein
VTDSGSTAKGTRGEAAMVCARRFVILVAALAVALAAPGLAQATQFKGSVDFWGPITITVSSNGTMVTAISGHSGGVTCASGTSVGPVDISLAAPVAIHGGRFEATGVGKTQGWGTPTSWSLSASVSIRRTISGTVSATAQVPSGEICKGTFLMSAVVAPRASRSPATAMYMPHEPSAASVKFDYRHGVLTHLVVTAPVICPDTTDFTAQLDSVSYSLDPIQVDRGRFKISTDTLDGYGVVMHITMTGTINGRNAAGAISASRGQDTRGTVRTCSMHGSWSSQEPTTAVPPTVASSGAFYSVTPYRYGATGAWTYFLIVEPTSCAGGVVAVKFTVSHGAGKTVPCGTKAKLGPLTPKQTYLVTATAIRRSGSPAPLAESNVYLPGDDGNWVPVKAP